MPQTEVETRRNGTAGSAMPIATTEIKLDDLGYRGWFVIMRTNPRSSVYDDLVSNGEREAAMVTGDTAEAEAERERLRTAGDKRWWKAFSQIVTTWNFADEDGVPMPHPREVEQAKDLDLPINLLAHVLTRYFDETRAAAAVPKAQPEPSAPTSSTSDGDQRTG